MNQVDILIQGYNKNDVDPEEFASTTTLIRTGEHNIVTDPGTHKSVDTYINALEKYGLTLDDIDYVFLTHDHLDHVRDVALFPNATVINRWGFHKGDEHPEQEDEEFEVFPGITRVAAPGHATSESVLFVDTKIGKVCVAGDVFWYADFGPEKDPYVLNEKELQASRKMVLERADYIIPGHDKMVKVER